MRQRPTYILKNPFYKVGFYYIGKTMAFDSLTRLYHFRHTLAIEFLAYAMKGKKFTPSISVAMKRHKDLSRFLDNAKDLAKSDFNSLVLQTAEIFTCDALQSEPIREMLASSLDKLEKNLSKIYLQRKP
jgi:hypothetical protein